MDVPSVAPVVVGVDGSDDSMAAIDFAASEAALRDRPLRLVYGFLWPALMPAAAVSPVVYEIDPRLEAEPILLEAAARASAAHPRLTIDTEVLVGSPAAVLIDESRTAALVVVGSRGRGGFSGLLAGSVSSQVATHAHGPVVVVRGETAAAGEPVLLGVDAAQPSPAAVGFAFEEAALRKAPLHALYAWSSSTSPEPGSPTAPPGYDFAEAGEAARRMLAEALAGWQERYPDVAVHREVSHSLDPPALLTRASEGAGLVVIGSRGRGELRSLLLGSCGYTLIHRAHCPVAVIHS